jgi:hypothetical protein
MHQFLTTSILCAAILIKASMGMNQFNGNQFNQNNNQLNAPMQMPITPCHNLNELYNKISILHTVLNIKNNEINIKNNEIIQLNQRIKGLNNQIYLQSITNLPFQIFYQQNNQLLYQQSNEIAQNIVKIEAANPLNHIHSQQNEMLNVKSEESTEKKDMSVPLIRKKISKEDICKATEERNQQHQGVFNVRRRNDSFKKRYTIKKKDVPKVLELLKNKRPMKEIKNLFPVSRSTLSTINQVTSPNFLSEPIEPKEELKKALAEYKINILNTEIDDCKIEREVLNLLLQKGISKYKISKIIPHVGMNEDSFLRLIYSYHKYVFLQNEYKK